MKALPRSEIMQSARNFHDRIIQALFGIPEHIFDNMTPFDARNDMLNGDPEPGNHLIARFFVLREMPTFGTFRGLDSPHANGRIALKPGILTEDKAVRKDEGGVIGQGFIMLTPGDGWPQIVD